MGGGGGGTQRSVSEEEPVSGCVLVRESIAQREGVCSEQDEEREAASGESMHVARLRETGRVEDRLSED